MEEIEEEEEEEEENQQNNNQDEGNPVNSHPSFPPGRVKKIMKLDRDINKVSSDAVLLISLSADLFLGFLAERAKRAATERKKRIIKLEHIRSAARGHAPTRDFLLDCLPLPEGAKSRVEKGKEKVKVSYEKPLPKGAQRIDGFFRKEAEIVEPNV